MAMPFGGVAALLAAAAIAAPAAVAAPRTQPQAPTRSLAARAVLTEINAVRESHHLRPFRMASRLGAAADQHSREMGERGYFSHSSADGTSFWKRVSRYYGPKGYDYWSVGENLLWSTGTLTPASAVTMWMRSPAHRANLLHTRWRQIGLSIRQFPAAPGVFQGLDVTIITADFGVRY